MNKHVSIFCFGMVLIKISCLEAVLIRFDYVRTTDNKHVYVFFERHNPASRVDVLQLTTLSRALLMRDSRKMPQLHLMIEVPSLLAQIRSPERKVTHNMIERVRHCPSISAEDVEIRCVSLAAEYMLGLSKQEIEDGAFLQDRFNAGNTWCCAGDITFEDVLGECISQEADIGADLDRFSFIRSFYWPKRDEIHTCEKELRRFLEKHSINTQERIADFIKRVSGLDSSFIKLMLMTLLSTYSSHLFDLHLMRKILLSTCSCQMVVVGAAHAQWLCSALEKIGASYQTSVSGECGLQGELLEYVENILTT